MAWPSAHEIASCVCERYAALSKTGKPARRSPAVHEWTVLAGIVLSISSSNSNSSSNSSERSVECVALGTGVKCLPPSRLDGSSWTGTSESLRPQKGTVLHDSHAEVVARRAFQRYLYDEIDAAINNRYGDDKAAGRDSDSDIFEIVDDGDVPVIRLRTDRDIQFHFYTSLAPCGDASMDAMNERHAATLATGDSATANDTNSNSSRKRKLESVDINGSGNGNGSGSAKRGRTDFDSYGAVRTKPGRTDAETTTSMSCSDMLSLWILLGLQSSLVANLVQTPIHISTVVVGEMAHKDGMERAFRDRLADAHQALSASSSSSLSSHGESYRRDLHALRLESTAAMFVDGSAVLSSKLGTDTQLIPADASIIWWKALSPPQPESKKQKKPMAPPEVCVAGRRQGISPAAFARGGSAAISMVSKRALFERYHRTVQLLSSHAKCATNLDVSGKTMRDVKNGATWHSKLKNLAKSIAPFDGWVQSPADCEDFSLS